MDFLAKWSNLPQGPSLKNLTDGGFGDLKETQHAAVQDLTKAHIDSFDQAVTDGLSRVVQVRALYLLNLGFRLESVTVLTKRQNRGSVENMRNETT